MAILKKGSRQLVVDGVTYRWRTRHKPTYDQGLTLSDLIVAVERLDVKGAILVVKMGRPHLGNWMTGRSTGVTPSEVTHLIHCALRLGWKPAASGKPFTLNAKGITS
jgi:hypothetical protein